MAQLSTADAVILTLNPGSSSLKASVRSPATLAQMAMERIGTEQAMEHAVEAVHQMAQDRGFTLDAVAHRVVHGGPHRFNPVIVDDAVLKDLREATPLAPLHMPTSLRVIAHARAIWPHIPHIVCFDTGFHQDLPQQSRRLPLPASMDSLGIRRYGFHGLSLQSVVDARPGLGNAVIAHLGSGCSVTAVSQGRSLHTTMSLTPTSGMISGSRSGDLDPEIPLQMLESHGSAIPALRELLNHDSGLAGVAGGRHDMRDLLGADDSDARLSVAMFVASAAMAIASCATALPSWDSLVFTGGIGEHAHAVREMICARLLPLRGPVADSERTPGEMLQDSGVTVLVCPADEESVLDRFARALIGTADRTP